MPHIQEEPTEQQWPTEELKDSEAAINIRHALESVGVDSDIALHQGFELVANFTGLAFHKGSYFHNEYLKAYEAMNSVECDADGCQARIGANQLFCETHQGGNTDALDALAVSALETEEMRSRGIGPYEPR